MKISIIVPIYKIPEEYLRSCIESLINQSYPDLEILLVDDGSPDNCGSIIDEYGKEHENIMCIHQENAGVSAARNNGLDHATGEYIIFVDGDDCLTDGICADVAEQLRKTPCDMMLFKYINASELSDKAAHSEDLSCKKVAANSRKKLLLSVIRQVQLFPDVELGSPWGKVFSKKFLDSNHLRFPLNIKKTQDRVFIANCLERVKTVYCFQRLGYIYNNINENSVCKRFNPNILSVIEQAGDLLLEVLFRQKDISEAEKKNARTEQSLRFMAEWLLIFFLHKEQNLEYAECKNAMKAARNSKTFRYLMEINLFDHNKIKKYGYGTKYDIVMQLLYHKCYYLLFLFKKVYQLYENRKEK